MVTGQLPRGHAAAVAAHVSSLVWIDSFQRNILEIATGVRPLDSVPSSPVRSADSSGRVATVHRGM